MEELDVQSGSWTCISGWKSEWEWGEKSTKGSYKPAVPSALQEDQPERRATNNHRQCGFLPFWTTPADQHLSHGKALSCKVLDTLIFNEPLAKCKN